MADKEEPDGNQLPSLRSCYRCSHKKIRCSKGQPCDNCVKSSSECVFPGPGRAARRKKRALKAELVSRVHDLEEELQLRGKGGKVVSSENASSPETSVRGNWGTKSIEHKAQSPGRLFVNGESAQYYTHEILVNIENQIGGLINPMNLPISINHSVDSPQGSDDTSQKGNQFLFGFSSMAVSLEAFHPSMAQFQLLWNIYQENVAPVLMIFHKPSLFRLVYKAASNMSYIDRASEAVVFAVYFAAVNSMGIRDCAEVMSHDHLSLREYYKFAAQQALARAGFFQSSNLAVLQAAVLFLTCLRSQEDADFVWMMTAAIHRKAQGLGLHRDGTSFGLNPFETEMRRRLWWYIYLLDSQSSELHAIDTLITEERYDTKMPLNINDSDISPESTQAPDSRVGFTEMTFCLIRIEITTRYRRLISNGHRENDMGNNKHASDLLGERLRGLEKIHSTLQERYLRFCDLSVPLQWVTATITRLALARLWVTTHFSQRSMAEELLSVNSPLEDTSRDQLFVTAIEVVEFALLLETDPRTSGWSWLFAGYPQWQAAVIVLVELCSRPQDVETQRAWAVIERAVSKWINKGLNEYGITMQTIFSLMERAAEAQGRGPDSNQTLELLSRSSQVA